MPREPTDDDVIRAVLGLRRWAVVGCSPDQHRDSNRVAGQLLEWGYDVTPVNPNHDGLIHGQPTFPALDSIPAERGAIEVVDVFRRSAFAGEAVDEAMAAGAVAVWLQLGVIDHDAADRAEEAGLLVVMDRCPLIERPRLLG